jgi:hypothetical protein
MPVPVSLSHCRIAMRRMRHPEKRRGGPAWAGGVLFADTYPIARATTDLPGFGMPNPKSPVTPDQFMQRPAGDGPAGRAMGLYTAGSNGALHRRF